MKCRRINVFALMLAGVLAVGSLSACSSGSSAPAESPAASEAPASEAPASESPADEAPANESPAPAEGGPIGEIIIATENETPSLTVAEHNATAASYMNALTHNGLFRTDSATMEPIPDLVESYQANSDVEWEFKIREDVYFHNGEQMTADDVVASLDYVKQFAEVSQYTKNVTNVEKVDDFTIKVTTEQPYSILLSDLTHHGNFIMPKAMLDEGADLNANPIGTGPYVFQDWAYGDSVSFTANENYFNPERAAKIKDMTWRIIPEGTSRTLALEVGEVDFIVELATQDIPRMQEDPNITVYMGPGTTHNYMMINNEKPQFSDIRVRKALDMAIDKEAIVAVALDGLADTVYTQVPMGFVGVSEEGVNSYDPEGAKALLAEAGVDPASLSFDIICSNDQKKRCGEVIQANLAEIGIEVTLSTTDLATYLDTTSQGNYEAAIGNYTSSSLLGYIVGVWHSSSINGSNRARLNDPAVDALIDTATTTVDPAASEQALLECTKAINEACGQVPLYQDMVKRAFNSKLVVPEIGPAGGLETNMMYWSE